MTKKNVIFVCSGNSCRSQMAQGWAWGGRAIYTATRCARFQPGPTRAHWTVEQFA